jgi:hypothetical protein
MPATAVSVPGDLCQVEGVKGNREATAVAPGFD